MVRPCTDSDTLHLDQRRNLPPNTSLSNLIHSGQENSPNVKNAKQSEIRNRRRSSVEYCICPHGSLYIPALLELHLRVRQRRRSRSSSAAGTSRSRTPSTSSGRTTPSCSSHLNGKVLSDENLVSTQEHINKSRRRPNMYTTTCWLEPRNVPAHYSSTVLIQLGSTKKKYIECVKFQVRLTPLRFGECIVTETDHHYASCVEVPGIHGDTALE